MKITRYRKNVLGTLSITLQAPNMKKPDEFTVYPIHNGQENQPIRIQSEYYWAEIYPEKAEIHFSSRRKNATSWTFSYDKAFGKIKVFPIDKEILTEILEKIGETSGEKVGNNFMGIVTDNSGASKLVNP